MAKTLVSLCWCFITAYCEFWLRESLANSLPFCKGLPEWQLYLGWLASKWEKYSFEQQEKINKAICSVPTILATLILNIDRVIKPAILDAAIIPLTKVFAHYQDTEKQMNKDCIVH